MGVIDGQAVDAAITNPAFINKNVDDVMPNKLGLSRALSGASIADIQAAVNKLYTATGASESQTGTAYNATPNTITNGDSYQTALTELADKFDPFTGHTHSGASGGGGTILATSIGSVPLLGYVEQGTQITGATGSSTNVSSLLSGKVSSSGSTIAGIPTTSPNNKIVLFYATSNVMQEIIDSAGNLVYGRITFAASVWTLSYYAIVGGTETAYSFAGSTNLNWYYQELFNPLSAPPVYNDQLRTKGSNPTATIIQAATAAFGKVQLSSTNPPDVSTASASGTSNGTVANADHTHKGLHSINAGASGNTFGDVILAASGGFQWDDQGQTKVGFAPPLTTNLPQPVSSSNTLGVGTASALDDHQHQGVHALAASGGSQLFGDVTLAASGGTGIAASGNQINVYSSPLSTTTPVNIGSAGVIGTGLNAARNDHTHQGVHSLAASGNSALNGDVVLAASGGTVLGESAQNINIYSNPLSTISALSVAATNSVGSSLSTSREDHTHQGLHSIAASGNTALFGDSVLVAGTGMTITQSGQNITFTSTVTSGVTSVAASGSAGITGAVVLVAGTGISLVEAGQNITIAATGNTSPLTTKGDLYTFTTVNARLPIGTDYQVLLPDAQQATGSRWATQSAGPKNYITYSDFENNATTGWSLGITGTLTNNIPTGTPTFGSGASGNLSIAIVSSNQLAGAFSLSYSSSAATTSGNMISSSALTIDAEDQAKVLTWRFYYKLQSFSGTIPNFSGTSSNSYAIAVYDVTNSSWLGVAGQFNLVQNSGIGYSTGTFQTNATTASIRFVIYNANATNNAATLYLDDFFLGPQTAPMGPAMSDDQTTYFVPTPSAGFGTTTNSSIFASRRGDKLVVHGSFKAGTVAGTTAFLSLSSLVMDTTKLGGLGNDVVGYFYSATSSGTQSNWSLDGSTTSLTSPLFFDGSTNNEIFLGHGTKTNAYQKTNVSTLFGNSDSIGFWFEVPIAGWSSNSVQSSDTDTRVVAAQISGYASGGTTASSTVIKFSTVEKDTHSGYSTSTGLYTVPVTGFYRVTAAADMSATWSATSTNNFGYISIFYNGSNKHSIAGYAPVSVTIDVTPSVSATIYANAGDTFGPYGLFGSGGSSTVINNSVSTFFSVERLSGPAVISATETVAARYGAQSGTSVDSAGTFTLVKFLNKAIDTHNAYNPSTGIYTVPVAGTYSVQSAIQTIQSNWVVTDRGVLCVVINGTQSNSDNKGITGPQFLIDATVSTSALGLGVTGITHLNAGDTVQIQTQIIRTGGNTSLDTPNNVLYFMITRVGN